MPNLPLRPTRLVIQSDCRLTRETLSACLAAADGFEVIGHTGTADGLRSLCALGRPDVCLVQAGELTGRTVHMLRSIHDSFPAVDLVVAYSVSPWSCWRRRCGPVSPRSSPAHAAWTRWSGCSGSGRGGPEWVHCRRRTGRR